MFFNIEALITLFFAFAIALMSAASRADLPKGDKALVESAFEDRQINEALLDKAIARLEALDKESKTPDEQTIGQLARLQFFKADNDENKEARIKKYQVSIDTAERCLKSFDQSALCNFWFAASLGRQGLDIGISKAFKNGPKMREKLEKALSVDEKMEKGGPHRALSRLYYKLPGWPISFGNNDKALEHAKKAYEIAPDFEWNKVYYAEILLKKKQKDLAAKLIDEVLAAKAPEKLPLEYKRWSGEAKKLKEDL